MNFLKILFWIVLTAVIVVFSLNNWKAVEVQLWGGLVADVKLPVLMLFFFLIGFIPALIFYRTHNWRLNRRLDTVERELSDARSINQFRAPERAAPAEIVAAEASPEPAAPPPSQSTLPGTDS